MLVTEISNHVEQALARFLQQYKGRPLLEGFMTALVTQIQELENSVYDQCGDTQLYNGTTYPSFGQQLDNLGTIIGLSRNGLTDQQYLIFLLGTIAENNSDTTANVMLNIVQTVFQSANVFIKTPNSPGTPAAPATIAFGVGSPQTPASLYPTVEQIIQNSLGAAISLVYLSTFNAQYAFSMAGNQPWVRGFSDLNNPLPTDGQFATLIFNNPVQ